MVVASPSSWTALSRWISAGWFDITFPVHTPLILIKRVLCKCPFPICLLWNLGSVLPWQSYCGSTTTKRRLFHCFRSDFIWCFAKVKGKAVGVSSNNFRKGTVRKPRGQKLTVPSLKQEVGVDFRQGLVLLCPAYYLNTPHFSHSKQCALLWLVVVLPVGQ